MRSPVRGYQWVFRVAAPAASYGEGMTDFLKEAAGATRLAIVYENTQFGSSVAHAALDRAPLAGIEVVAFEAYDAGGTDFTPLLTRVKSANPDGALYISYLADATLLMRQSKEMDFNPKVFTAGGSGFSLPDFLKGAGDTAEYTVSITQWTPDAGWSGSRDWAASFRARYNSEQLSRGSGLCLPEGLADAITARDRTTSDKRCPQVHEHGFDLRPNQF
jgi:branched-chain amino acid transport system substrate-binding protein